MSGQVEITTEQPATDDDRVAALAKFDGECAGVRHGNCRLPLPGAWHHIWNIWNVSNI